MKIKYLKHIEIDKTKWNECIMQSVNGLVYGNSWYLDIVCENWDALIIDNYKAVMPLPWKRKFGLKYIYHPFFSQQLGIFYKDESYNKVSEIVKHIPLSFIKYELSCNYANKVMNLTPNPRVNYTLNIDKSYKELQDSFSDNTKRNIKKGERNYLDIRSNITTDDFLKLKKQNNISGINHTHFDTLHELFSMLLNNNYAKIVGSFDNNGTLVGAALFVEFKNRITYLFSASNDIGKSKRVMFAIVNSIIKENTEQGKIIDFEGSMIEGVARFFKGFGAEIEIYNRINKSKIPFIK